MLRTLKLPGDLRVGVDLIFRGFQEQRSDKKEVAVDSLRTLQFLWPLIQVGRLVSPTLRDIFPGYIWEEDSQPVGFVTFDPEGSTGRWEVGIIVVLPEYRRRGIARNLMQASIDFIRDKGGKAIVLDAAAESAPACILYENLGFERVFTSVEFNHQAELPPGNELPDGYELIPLKPSDWRTRYELEQRIVPANAARYDPVEESRFRMPWAIQAIQSLIWKFSGQKPGQIAVRSPEGQIVAWGNYLARLRKGGVNYITMRIDPKHDAVASSLVSHMIRLIQHISPGRRIMFSVPDWQDALIQASLSIGSTERTRYHRMGMFL
jgi:ribosomal protein S18 acetylase RimI-like enzyme